MSIKELETINNNFYMGALHLFEAGKYFSNIDPEYANSLFTQSKDVVESIMIIKDKVADEELDSILDKIMAFDLNEHEKLKDIETGLTLSNE